VKRFSSSKTFSRKSKQVPRVLRVLRVPQVPRVPQPRRVMISGAWDLMPKA
jgi:hypothetical protein